MCACANNLNFVFRLYIQSTDFRFEINNIKRNVTRGGGGKRYNVSTPTTCVVCHSGSGRLCTLKYNSFRWRSIRMFNRLPKAIHMLSSCSVIGFKSELDSYLRNIVDLPCQPGYNNSLDGGDCLHGGHYADDLAPN